MHTLLVPIPQPRFDFRGALGFLALHFGEEEGELLSECVKALPPVVAAVLVAVADEELVE